MGRLRITILGMIAIVVASALAFAALRTASDLWLSAVYTFTTVLLLVALIAARYGDQGARAFWFGFAVFGWGFFLIELGPWTYPFAGNGFYVEDEDLNYGGLNPQLLTSKVIYVLVPYLRRETDNLEAIDKITKNTIVIAHLLITLMLALGGGFLAVLIRRYRGRARSSRSGKIVASVVILSGLALGIAASSSGSARSAGPYFPPEVLDEEKGISEFRAEWYSKHLAALGEPALWTIARRDRETTIYRLLWLPSFDHPVCVRIDRTNRGATLHAMDLDGQGGYAPGQMAIDRRFTLDERQWRDLAQHLEAASFWNMPTTLPDDGGSDGDQLIVEAIQDGRYHVVDRWEPDTAYAELCRSMLDMTGLKLQKAWDSYH